MRPRKPSGVLSVNSMPSFEHVCDTETLLGTLYKRKRYKWKTPTIDAIGRRGTRSFPLIKVEELRLLEMGWIGNVDASSVVLAQFAVVEYSRGIRCPVSGFGTVVTWVGIERTCSFWNSHMKFNERHWKDFCFLHSCSHSDRELTATRLTMYCDRNRLLVRTLKEIRRSLKNLIIL